MILRVIRSASEKRRPVPHPSECSPAMSDATESRAGLVLVDSFTVTFLVDNCIEW